MTEKALVAVNDSKAALNAFLEALQLSRRFGFQLGAVCVAPPYQGDLALVGVRAIKRTLSEPSLTVLDEAIRIAAEDGVALVTFAASGSRCEAIIDLAVKEKYDLIIIGQAPRRRWSFVGSLTASLLRHSPVDILVIPFDGEATGQASATRISASTRPKGFEPSALAMTVRKPC